MFKQEIDERPQSEGDMATLRIEQGKRPRASAVGLEHFQQRAISQFLFDNEAIGLKQPRAVFRQGHATQYIVGTTEVALRQNFPSLIVTPVASCP